MKIRWIFNALAAMEPVLCPALCLMYAFCGLRLAVYGRVLMIRELEEKMWRAAQARDKAAFT